MKIPFVNRNVTESVKLYAKEIKTEKRATINVYFHQREVATIKTVRENKKQ